MDNSDDIFYIEINDSKNEKIIDYLKEMKTIQIKETSKINNCICCDRYIIIHDFELNKLFNNINNKSNRVLKLLYRLRGDLFDYPINNNIIPGIDYNLESFKYKFEIYFYNQSLEMYSFLRCSICLHLFCPLHISINEFYKKHCNYCNKYWFICTWCKYDTIRQLFDINYTKISNEDELCNLYHILS